MLLFSCEVTCDSSQSHGLEMPGFSILHYLLEFAQIHVH